MCFTSDVCSGVVRRVADEHNTAKLQEARSHTVHDAQYQDKRDAPARFRVIFADDFANRMLSDQ